MSRNHYSSPRVFRLNGTVGVCGTNNSNEVKTIQTMIGDAGYKTITGRTVLPTGICNSDTIEAIRWYQRLLNLSPTGLIHPVDHWIMEALATSGGIFWRPQHVGGSLKVRQGQFTFDNEGIDYITAVEPFRQPQRMPSFSRILHWPGTYASGVTLGRGYDMGNRSAGQILFHLRQAGIEEYKAQICARASGLKGRAAARFVQDYGRLTGEITHLQQIKLFEIVYPDYVNLAKNYYIKYTQRKVVISDAPAWSAINERIKDVYVDIIFQGVDDIKTLVACVAKNDNKQLIMLIRKTRSYMGYENNRHRIGYLQ
ncbi:peptidoglycan-binding protein [Cronobacter sakazakii]|uniref:peptidoglycan-binding protein n=1 Tax=Cronobacter sakazakii TaxID=28141 RepID=UPI000BE86B7F|nr:peptidoglycan-binding protein [Cronobacter sakazakii]EIX1502698.1 peptidoglycan-binding protein [Cronobacter sakazakii]EIX1506040.1 peptidoglycan-binding protein [Cronobacter sakazakii]EIX1523571.1 peptidoglycan-binding protein [Cronobacter sakazakii]EIX1535125.1 peptidoglycan-binding protein [Cronobacter sakazakii]EIX1621549.1 peptidoglycan-binding protein [Cronobacter sakazakii]